ncbi:DUF58 domain-containing protein [Desulfoplanes formicivorans]|uniref:Uncharacterized protein n=1 Tax=Desulfoplanes formicivorans TaxID=1592317 RepID=A0A194ADP8_9BACT|nr:DUF58 domain-containing protein [Desulfoplanes formicivorans]GAU08202.1 hypothetical protein DPF_0905 [Desulfoplanes formicivorans]
MNSPPGIRYWLDRRPRVELPVVLDGRHIFILPTKCGLLFALLLIALLVGSLNYTNNLGLFLTFLLASMGFVSIFHAHAQLRGLHITRVEADEVFAPAPLILHVHCRSRFRQVHDIRITLAGEPLFPRSVDLHPGKTRVVKVVGKGRPRGIHPLPPMVISTTYPLGLFRAWSTVAVRKTCAVFPEPSGPVTLVSQKTSGHVGRDQGMGRQPGSDDFQGLRPYVPGDPLQRVAWKASSRGTGLLTKEFVTGSRRHVGLCWDDVAGSDEERLAKLCAMVLAADKQGVPYWLELPGHVSDVDQGPDHRHECLMRLASYGMDAGGEG